MNEFELIRQIQRQTSVLPHDGVKLGIGDDAAVLEIPTGQQLVVTTDTLNTGVHFPANTAAFDLGHKCLAVSLSDLAAMGASPQWALLSLSMPQSDPDWLRSFMAGFKSLAERFGVALIGGDTTRGPLSIGVTALGLIEPGAQLMRSGARPGDLLVVSGTVGGAARIVDLLRDASSEIDRTLLDRPQPRVGLGQALVGHASACIDISDGLLADLGHLLTASGCAANVEIEKLPAPAGLQGLADEQKLNYQLTGGDDYELLFTLPPGHAARIEYWRDELGIRLSVIGSIAAGEGISCIAANGAEFHAQKTGWDHFGDKF